MTHHHHNSTAIGALTAILLTASACGRTAETAASEETTTADYHADNDIAMTIASVVDALTVGEPLDSASYDFEGVLTDGTGAPLYTDVQGAPGKWEVNVTDTATLTLRNLYLGDLFPDDLEAYITEALGLGPDAIVTQNEYADDHETDMNVYSFGAGEIRFETRAGIAPNGLEGPLLRIVISSRRASTPTAAR